MDESQDFTALAGLLETYRKNRQNVPEEVLKTKYKDGWEKLKDSIAREAESVAKRYLFRGRVLFRDDWLDPGGVVEQTVAAWTAGGYPKRCGRALFRNMDLDEFRIILEDARKEAGEIHKKYLAKRESEGKETT